MCLFLIYRREPVAEHGKIPERIECGGGFSHEILLDRMAGCTLDEFHLKIFIEECSNE